MKAALIVDDVVAPNALSLGGRRQKFAGGDVTRIGEGLDKCGQVEGVKAGLL